MRRRSPSALFAGLLLFATTVAGEPTTTRGSSESFPISSANRSTQRHSPPSVTANTCMHWRLSSLTERSTATATFPRLFIGICWPRIRKRDSTIGTFAANTDRFTCDRERKSESPRSRKESRIQLRPDGGRKEGHLFHSPRAYSRFGDKAVSGEKAAANISTR